MIEEEQPYPDTNSPEDEGLPEMEGPPEQQRATSDAPEGMVIPRDHPRAADAHGVTATEQREGKDLADRLDEEEPERASGPARERTGRLVDEAGEDAEKDLVGDEAEEDTAGLTAEEDAMRVVDEAPGATSHEDDYTERGDY